MTTEQAAYRAGCIVAEVEARFVGPQGLGSAVFAACPQLPARLPVHLRHLWPKAIKDPAVLDLLDGWECPDRPFAPVEQGPFWMGYYHQKTARSLPADFGPRLKALRESRRMSLDDLATAAGVTKQSLSLYEQGKRRPTWDAVQAIAEALGVSTDTFRDQP